jgi:hypothetical protein
MGVYFEIKITIRKIETIVRVKNVPKVRVRNVPGE